MRTKASSSSNRAEERRLASKKQGKLYTAGKEIAKSKREAVHEINELRVRLREIKKILQEVKNGDVDTISALQQVYESNRINHFYYLLFRDINQGAIVLFAGGTIIYCNRRFAELLKRPFAKTVGSQIFDFISAKDTPILVHMLEEGKQRLGGRGEIKLKTDEGRELAE